MTVAAAALAFVATVFLLRCEARTFAVCIVLAMFVTRPAVSLGGFEFRVEILVGCVSCVRLVAGHLIAYFVPRSIAIIYLLGVWLLVLTYVSWAVAPLPSRSLSLAAWTAVNIGSALWLSANAQVWKSFLRAGSVVNVLVMSSAIIMWVASFGGHLLGVQLDTAYGGYAAYVLSLEANLLASLLCTWSLISLLNPLGAVSIKIRRLTFLLTPIAILATHTRAALIAYVLGLLLLVLTKRGVLVKAVGPEGVLLLVGAGVLWPRLSTSAGLDKFRSPFDLATGTGGQRVGVATSALRDWFASDRQLFGFGYNTYGQTHYEPTLPGEFVPAYVGNLPVQLVYDGGLFAVVVLIVVAVLVASPLLATRRSVYVVVLGLPYLVMTLSTSSIWLLQTWAFVGIAIGLVNAGVGGGGTQGARNRQCRRVGVN